MPGDREPVSKLWKKRPTVGLLGSPMHSEQGFWVGVADAAEAYQVNLVVFLGGAVMTEALKATVRYELIGVESAAVLYDLVDIKRLDGLVTWAGTGAGLGIHLNQDEMDVFFRRYHPLPIINYEKVVEGIPTVLTDTAQGMHELMLHLIEVHGCRRIALLRGLPTHFESNERHRAYNETLTEYGLALDSNLVCSATGWGQNQGVEMIRLLLNERGLRAGVDFDAVVGTEGQYGVGAVQELQTQGVHVPDDVIVAAYNDLSAARVSAPPITVMRKSFYDAGWKSLELLLDLLQGKPVPEKTLVPSRLVIRRSCGCLPREVQAIADLAPVFPLQSQPSTPQTASLSLATSLVEHQQEIVAAVTQSIDSLVLPERAAELATRLVNALFADIKNGSTPSHNFLSTLENALRATSTSAQDLEHWQSVISALRRYTPWYGVDNRDTWFRVENLWQQARIVVQLEAQRLDLNNNLEDLLLALTLREAGKRFFATFDIEVLMDSITEELPKLGIHACYLSLYEDPQSYKYPQVAPEWSRLVLAFDEHGRIELPPHGRQFRSHQLIPDDLPLPDKRVAMVVVPLYFAQQQFGFTLLEIGPKKGMLYTELWQLIGSALQVVLLSKERLDLAVERERVTILADFIRDVGHEFKTPLSIINTSLYLFNKHLDPDKRTQHLEKLHVQSVYLHTLVEAMLTMSRLDSNDELAFVPLNVRDLLQDLEMRMRVMVNRKQLTFTVEIESNIPDIQGDREELSGALAQIVQNAIQFTPRGGENKIRAYTNANSVIIEIIDTGIGIDETDLSRIFERFYRVNESRTDRGAGLGLSIAKKVIVRHRGSIKVESSPGKGSIFRVILPRIEVLESKVRG